MTMSDAIGKWAGGVAAALSVSAVGAVFFMWNTLNTIIAQEPLRDQLHAIELEQIRQGIQLNTAELSVVQASLDDLDERLDDLED